MSFDIMLQQAIRFQENGQIDEAENIYRELLNTAPEHPDLHYLIGLIAVQKKAFSSAVDFLAKAVSQKPDSIPFVFSLAHALQEWGKHFEALENYRKVNELDPNIPETWNNMGNIYRIEGEPNKAKEYFKTALGINPEMSIALNNLALVNYDLNEIEEAKENLKKALNITPEYDEALFNLANIYREENNLSEALPLYHKATTVNPKFARCFNSLGIALEKQENYNDAEEAFRNAIKIAPKYADAIKNLGNILFATKQFDKAEDAYKDALKIDKNLFDAYVNLGNLLQTQNRVDEALEYYRKAIIINPEQPEVCNNLALAVQATGDIEEAIGLFCSSLYLKPDLIQTKYNLALAIYDLYFQQDQEKAIKITENWLRNVKNDPVATHLLLSLKGETLENGASSAYLTEFFDAFALDFEKTLDNLKYQTPNIIGKILSDLNLSQAGLNILDLGCGTGLCGKILKPYAQTLVGIDLSSKMLEKAKDKRVYDRLEQQDLKKSLNQTDKFDLIIAADVFCYFGNLKTVISQIASCLEIGGYAIFSIEEEINGNNFQIYPSGRYKHNFKYLEDVIFNSGLTIIELKKEQIRLEKNEPVLGIIAIVKKP
ncbi:MAG: tetratricopeptide repeat protein [Alphaproteobacteria bacterium]